MTAAADSPGLPGHGEVHLWRLPQDPDARAAFRAAGEELLSVEEKARLDAMNRPGPAERFLRGRVLMRRVLGLYLSVDSSAVPLPVSENGKPATEDGLSPGIAFSLSHTVGESVFAVSRTGAIGVDIEAIARADAAMRISDRQFTEVERGYIDLGGKDRAERALTIWCLKEAVVKAMGRTVWTGLTDVVIGVADGRFTALSLPENARSPYNLTAGRIDGACLVAVATDGSHPLPTGSIRTFRLAQDWSETDEFVSLHA